MLESLVADFDQVEIAKKQIVSQLKAWRELVVDAELAIRNEQSFIGGEALESQLREALVQTYQNASARQPTKHAGKRLKRLFLDVLLVLSGQTISVPSRQLVYENLVKFRYYLENGIQAIGEFSG